MGFVNQWKGINWSIVRDPHDFLAGYDQTNSAVFPIAFMLASFIAVMVPLGSLSVVLNITAPADAAVGFAAFLSIGIVLWLIALVEALLVHGIAYLAGARGLTTTLEAYAFPTLVRYAVWWIPLVNFAFGLYGLYLQMKGLASFHDIPMERAVVAVLFVPFLYIVLFIAVFVAAFASGI
ncbi:YIP1 family protein [Natronobacterium texcoconense]|uniref:Yip1 domain-containing protein n=1 Tax=Natronobacterium texcoconense TaxID=1095778 RepID=A0A1H0ZM29_NATTX|nr:YIP1 family protein [Natronobacterium texcoconense]SDQ28397.1 hypothetical protein SAMN04489842_0346 [Natronobacterium texcoconense]